MTRNAILLVAGRMASALTTLGVLAVVGRMAGAESLGLLSIGFVAGQIGAVLTELGLTGYVVREGARSQDRLRAAYSHALGVRSVTVPTIAVVGAATIAVAGGDATVVLLAGSSLVVQSLADLTRSVSLAKRRGDVWATHAIIENVSWFLVIALVLAGGGSLSAALAAGAAVMLASFVGGLVVVGRLYDVHPRPRLAGWSSFRVTAPFAAYALLGTAYLRSDTLLVAALVPGSGLVAAAAYYATLRLLAAFEYIPEATSVALLPELAEGHAKNPEAVAPLVQRAARLLVIVAIPVPFLMLLIAGDLLPFLFGRELAGYGWVLVLLSVLVPVRCYQWLAGAVLTGTDQQVARAAAVGAGLVALLLADTLLIPRVGISGAVAGSAIGLATVVGIYASRLRVVTVDLVTDGGVVWSTACAVIALGAGALGLQIAPIAGATAFVLVYVIGVARRLIQILGPGVPVA